VQIPEDGGEGRVVFQTGFEVNWVRGLPGARATLVGLNNGSVCAVDLQSSGGPSQSTALAPLLGEVRAAWYAPTGHLIYVRDDGSVFAAPFDVDGLEITAGETPLFGGVRTSILNGRNTADIQLGDDGTLLYVEGSSSMSARQLVLVDRTGREEPLGFPVQAYLFPRYSPDGRRVAVSVAGVDTDLWVLDLGRLTSPTRVTFGGDNRFYPVWSHDGQWLTFTNDAGGGNALIRAAADGSGLQDTLYVAQALVRPTSWSRDGRVLVYHEVSEATGRDLWALEGGVPREILATPFEERNAVLSPNGRWLAYESNRSGGGEIYVRPYPGPGPEITVSTGGGGPTWARDGSELYYRSPDQFMAVAVEYGTELEVGVPVALFDDPYLRSAPNAASYDVAPDGRFLMLRDTERLASQEARLILVENFFEELRARVP